MRKYLVYTPLIMIPLFILSCEGFLTRPGLYTVEGVVADSRGSVVNAQVSVDDAHNWTTKTDANGAFSISDVSEGEHDLSISNEEADGKFITKTVKISVYDDLVLDALRLPTPVMLFPVDSIQVSSMALRWNESDAEDFVEYKLYQHDSPGLDETTGELIYVATEADDTTFTATGLLSSQTYYFRVYIMNQFGRLGGSNIVNAITIKGNLIPDGGFEDPTSFSSYWFLNTDSNSTSIHFVDSIKVSGGYALYIQSSRPTSPYMGGGTLRLVSPLALAQNATYRLSAWVKASGYYVNDVPLLIEDDEAHGLMFLSGDWPWGSNPVDLDWTHLSTTFLKTTDNQFSLTIYFGTEHVWIDSLSLVPL